MYIGERLEQLRTYIGLTQQEMSAHIGMSASSISDYEEGDREVTDDFLVKLNDAYGINPDWVKTGVGSPFEASTKIDQVIKMYLNLTREERVDVYNSLMHKSIE